MLEKDEDEMKRDEMKQHEGAGQDDLDRYLVARLSRLADGSPEPSIAPRVEARLSGTRVAPATRRVLLLMAGFMGAVLLLLSLPGALDALTSVIAQATEFSHASLSVAQGLSPVAPNTLLGLLSAAGVGLAMSYVLALAAEA